jgi:hypothetical protein
LVPWEADAAAAAAEEDDVEEDDLSARNWLRRLRIEPIWFPRAFCRRTLRNKKNSKNKKNCIVCRQDATRREVEEKAN